MNPNDRIFSAARVVLIRALRRLADDQGRIARRNARGRVKRALRRIEDLMDDEFPAIRKERVTRPRVPARLGTRPLTAEEKVDLKQRRMEKRFKAEGFVELPLAGQLSRLTDLAAAGVRIRRDAHGDPWVPRWTLAVGPGQVTKLRELRRSSNARKIAVTEMTLGSQGAKED